MLSRQYPITLIMLWATTAATALAEHHTGHAPAHCAPQERTIHINKWYVIPEEHATTMPKVTVRQVPITVPTMGLKVDFKEEKRTVCITTLKPREEERLVKSTTMVPETCIDPVTHCETIRYKEVCLTKVVKVTVMDCVQETREVTVKVPVVTPVETAVSVMRVAIDVSTQPAVATTYRAVCVPNTITVPLPPLPCLPPPCVEPTCGQPGHRGH